MTAAPQDPPALSAPAGQVAIPATTGGPAARIRRRFERAPTPTVGVGTLGRAVAQDLTALVKAEVALARAEAVEQVKANVPGIAALAGAAVLAWLGVQGLLITVALLLALVLPAWAAALIVTVVLLAVAAVAAKVGTRMLPKPVTLETTKDNVREDVAWIKTHLPKR
ncbi:MAG: phage holin family protein [Actinomycetota bacterium]|nr:phage holin family protein [Actinomycetota bacterium]